MKERLSRRPVTVFFIVYTLLFVLFVRLAGFLLPPVLALLICAVMKPLYDYLKVRFRFQSVFAATSLTLLVFAAFLAAVGFILFIAIRQALGLLDKYGYLVAGQLRSGELFSGLRDSLISGDLLNTASAVASALFQAVPLAITFVVITFALTVYLLHHIRDLSARLLERAGEEYAPVMERILRSAYTMVQRFIRSYLILYLLTFGEALFIFCITGVEYPFAFAFVTAVADILPVLGPGTVYVPLGIAFILQKNYISGITLLIFFVITVILRQILEPRIVSDSVKVHPLAVLAAIYCSVVSMDIWVLFYGVSVLMAYRVLDTAGVFDKTG